jgi:hypothetical protein
MLRRPQSFCRKGLRAAVATSPLKPSGFATTSTAGSRSGLASYAAARRAKHTTSSSPQPRALGRKVSDEFTVPFCRLHRRELHRYGDEASWWVNVDLLPIALELWQRSKSTALS